MTLRWIRQFHCFLPEALWVGQPWVWVEGKCEVVNTFGFDQRFVGSAGGAQDVGGVGLVLGRLERSPRHVAGPGLGLPDLVSGGQEPLVHETLSLPSEVAPSTPRAPAVFPPAVSPRPARRGEGRGRVGLVGGGGGMGGGGGVVTERGLGPPLSPGTLTPPPPLCRVLWLAPHPPERRRGRLGSLPEVCRGSTGRQPGQPGQPGPAARPARERVEPPGPRPALARLSVALPHAVWGQSGLVSVETRVGSADDWGEN